MEQTSATMLEAMTPTSLSSRICALVCSAMISRRRRSNRRGPPAADIRSFPACHDPRECEPSSESIYMAGENGRDFSNSRTSRPNDPHSRAMTTALHGVKLIGRVQCPNRQFDILLVDQHAAFDL